VTDIVMGNVAELKAEIERLRDRLSHAWATADKCDEERHDARHDARVDALEEAAKVVEARFKGWSNAEPTAAAIRALKEKIDA
jgi:hypothetical protein